MKPYKYASLVVITTILMAVSFPVGKIGLSYAPPFLMTGIRFVLAGALLALIVAGRPLPKGWTQWRQTILLGLFQSAGVMGCCYYSMRWLTSSESTIMTSTSPLIVIVLGSLLIGTRYRFHQWLGVIIGFAGIFFSFGAHVGLHLGTVIGFAGAVSFAIATLLIKRWSHAFDLMVLTAYQMLAGGILLLLFSAIVEQPYFIVTATSVTVILWLAIMSSIVQFTLWFYLLQNSDPAKTSAFLFLVPVFGVGFSWLLLGEQLHWYLGVGGLLTCVGIYLVNWERNPRENVSTRASG